MLRNSAKQSASNRSIEIKLVFEDGTPYKLVSNLNYSSTLSDLTKYSGPGFDVLTPDGFVVSDGSTPLISAATHVHGMTAAASNKSEFYIKLRSKRRTAAALQANEFKEDVQNVQSVQKVRPVRALGGVTGVTGVTGVFEDCYDLTHSQKLQVISNCGLLFGRIFGETPHEAPRQLLTLMSGQIGASHFRFRKKLVHVDQIARNGLVSKWSQQGFTNIDSVDIETVSKTGSATSEFVKKLANLSDNLTELNESKSESQEENVQTAFAKELHQRAVIYINEDLVQYDSLFLRKLDAILNLNNKDDDTNTKEQQVRQVRQLKHLEAEYGSIVVTEAALGTELGVKGYFQKKTDKSEEQAMSEVLQIAEFFGSDVLKRLSTGALMNFADEKESGADSADITARSLYVRGGEPSVASMQNIAKWMAHTAGKHENWVVVQVLKCKSWYFMLDSARKQQIRALIELSKRSKDSINQLAQISKLSLLQKKKDREIADKSLTTSRKSGSIMAKFLKQKNFVVGLSDDDDIVATKMALWPLPEEFEQDAEWEDRFGYGFDAYAALTTPQEVVIRGWKDDIGSIRVINNETGKLDSDGHTGTNSIFYATTRVRENITVFNENSKNIYEIQFKSASNGKYLVIHRKDQGNGHEVLSVGHSRGSWTWFRLHEEVAGYKFENVEYSNKFIRARKIDRHPSVDVGTGGATDRCRFGIFTKRRGDSPNKPYEFENKALVQLRRKPKSQFGAEGSLAANADGEVYMTHGNDRDNEESKFEAVPLQIFTRTEFLILNVVAFRNILNGRYLRITEVGKHVDCKGPRGLTDRKIVFLHPKVEGAPDENVVKLQSRRTEKYLEFRPNGRNVVAGDGIGKNAIFELVYW